MERENHKLTLENIIHSLLHNRLINFINNILILILLIFIIWNNEDTLSYILVLLLSTMALLNIISLLYLSWRKHRKIEKRNK